MEIIPIHVGAMKRPMFAIVGVWDPPLPEHRELFTQLAHHARNHGGSSVAVTLDPDPAVFGLGQKNRIVYCDTRWRFKEQKDSGIDLIFVVALEFHEKDRDAFYFLTHLTSALPISDLWFGSRQTFGQFQSRSSISAACARLAITARLLPDFNPAPKKVLLRRLVAEGRIAEAYSLSGFPPIWRRPELGDVRLTWSPGTYTVVPFENALPKAQAHKLNVELTKYNGWTTFTWPRSAPHWIAFVSGPRDEKLSYGTARPC